MICNNCIDTNYELKTHRVQRGRVTWDELKKFLTLAGGVILFNLGAPILLDVLTKCFLYWGPLILAISQISQEHFEGETPEDLVVGAGGFKDS